MRTFVLLLLSLIPAAFASSYEKNGRGARPIAMANAFVAVPDDPWTPWYNPASLATVSCFKSSLCFVPEQYGLRELRTMSAAAVLPTSLVNVGLVIDDFGSPLYRESTVLFGFGRAIESGVAIGVAANVEMIMIERYGTASVVTIDLGARVELLECLSLGYAWKNIGAATIGASHDALSQIQIVGLCYSPNDLAQMTLDLEKDIRFPFVLRGGIELHLLDELVFRFGCSTNPDIFAVGFGARLAGWECAYALNTHAQLGLTHSIGISFEIPR